ncbi:MAG TPA: hypothetical protein VFI47_11125, partial [Acidimicrobiales bacterium]|nr:hypothetical protein [Acidimicrobiales bacterium]
MPDAAPPDGRGGAGPATGHGAPDGRVGGDAGGAHTQARWDVRFDWGAEGLRHVGPGAAAVVVVDVLRFTTAVSVAVGRRAEVLPYAWDAGA